MGDTTQRAMVAARLANMVEGRPPGNSALAPSLQITQSDAAAMLNVGERSVHKKAPRKPAGLYPARKAAMLQPVDALRQE